jgi:hypothetical protein
MPIHIRPPRRPFLNTALAVLFVLAILATAASCTHPRTPSDTMSAAPSAAAPATFAPADAHFFGIPVGPRAARVVYVCDRSYSMSASLAFIGPEIHRSIASLGTTAQFEVIYFASNQPAEIPTRMPTETDAEQLVEESTNGTVTRGTRDPAAALAKALALRPDVIYLLTDAKFVLTTLDLARPPGAEKKTTIHTLCIIYNEGEEILKKLAATTGGTCRFLSPQDLILGVSVARSPALTGTEKRPSPIQPPPSSILGRSAFFNIPAGSKVVYIVDRSGSMTDCMDFVKYGMKRSIGLMDEDAEFHIIFYTSGQPVEMPTRKLVRATDTHRQRAAEFIDRVIAQGESDPSAALQRAFALQPDIIFLLTDGEFDRKVVSLIRRLNADDKVTVHTMGFIYTNADAMLMQIARENGGTYTFVSEKSLENMDSE